VPARVVQRHPAFFRELQEAGVEIAVHGYEHVALADYSSAEASAQLVKAVGVFARQGIAAHGFRCPYLSYTSDLIDALPQGLLGYSSNRAIAWDVVPEADRIPAQPTIAGVLRRVYQPAPADEMVAVPSTRAGIVEIPVSLPDDLELHDACGMDAEAIGEVWDRVLQQTHGRGELFVLMYHPELTERLCQPLTAVLSSAARLSPRVWVARLQDINAWWREKSSFAVDVSTTPTGLELTFACSPRATVLARHVGIEGAQQPWDGTYRQVDRRVLHVPGGPRPFVGVDARIPAETASFLREQGYVLDTGPTAQECAVYLDASTCDRLHSQRAWVRTIEQADGPLVRYGRWPDGAKSALAVTGDLDALTLLDYASRLFAR
jgi:hypothetical protein